MGLNPTPHGIQDGIQDGIQASQVLPEDDIISPDADASGLLTKV